MTTGTVDLLLWWEATKPSVASDRFFLPSFLSTSHSSLRSDKAYSHSRPIRNPTPRSLSLWQESQKRDRRGERRKYSKQPFKMFPSRLPDLPLEIWEHILHFVPEPSIYDIKLVNHQLRELIADSTSLQYRLQLYRAGYEDNTRVTQPSVTTKREQLREYEAAWLDGECAVPVREVFKGTSGPELTGDTLVTMGRARMRFIKLPSKAKRLPTRGWTVDLTFDGWSVAMHPPTNVMVVSEYTGSISSVPIHILRMDTGQPHPLASIPALQHDVRDNFAEIYPPFMSISQSVVAILFRESGQAEQVIDEDRLFVWNWRTGSKILSLNNTYYETLTLFSDTWLVAGYAFRPVDDRLPDNYALHLVDTSTKPVETTRFELSVPSYGDHGHFAGLHSGESAFYGPPSEVGPQPPFLPTSSEAIVTARIQMCDTTTDEHAAYCVTLRLCELLELAKRGGPYVRWEDWAAYTSIWEKKGLIQHIFSDFCVSGWRLACPLKGVEPGKLTFEIHEFNSCCGPPTSLSNVKKGKESEGKVASNLRSSKRVKELVFKCTEGLEDLTNLSTNVMITEDNLILVTWTPGIMAWSMTVITF
ncbi:hypothetical protein BDM02DRAFT_3110812 [Thelephora ganbajun]|uniref:Uncharacterized protein n=1 Tax=Thelephora ganbajun TaxID=370292 RepID=A0ACB6ZPB4_THEGA|nr:hypothetical protein BDM02DRAFT_3110812 [Thelephora ganbajun]